MRRMVKIEKRLISLRGDAPLQPCCRHPTPVGRARELCPDPVSFQPLASVRALPGHRFPREPRGHDCPFLRPLETAASALRRYPQEPPARWLALNTSPPATSSVV